MNQNSLFFLVYNATTRRKQIMRAQHLVGTEMKIKTEIEHFSTIKRKGYMLSRALLYYYT